MTDDNFKLKSNDAAFASRSKDIFANIDSLAAEKQDIKSIKIQEDKNEESSSKTTEEFKGRESIFRTPNESGWPVSNRRFDSGRSRFRNHQRPRKVPDHVVNPQKYKKYDLSDVDQMSDRSNTRAAFDFLRQLKDRKSVQDSDDDQADNPKAKIAFKKPKNKPSSSETASSSNVARDGGHKRVMPECVVGASSASKKVKSSEKKLSNKTAAKAKISLAHLDDEEEDDD